jgi:hypothetical protein
MAKSTAPPTAHPVLTVSPDEATRKIMSVVAPHWLIIVSRDKPELYERLQESFSAAPLVWVIFDRRRGERRRAGGSAAAERRRSDRRRPPSVRETSPEATYRLIQHVDGVLVLQATQRVPARCPECQADLEFEMPRFAEPPSRLSMDVRHVRNGSTGAQHYVEAEAFKATGRSLLACRILARRVAGFEPLIAVVPQFVHA